MLEPMIESDKHQNNGSK